MTKRWYGVSHGDGNIGVSHVFPDYYVYTDDPWRLAELAVASYFEPACQLAALDAAEIDGDEETVIRAVIYSESDVEDDAEQSEDDEAWLITDVFPEPNSDWRAKCGCPEYDSLESCFSKAELALCAKTEGSN